MIFNSIQKSLATFNQAEGKLESRCSISYSSDHEQIGSNGAQQATRNHKSNNIKTQNHQKFHSQKKFSLLTHNHTETQTNSAQNFTLPPLTDHLGLRKPQKNLQAGFSLYEKSENSEQLKKNGSPFSSITGSLKTQLYELSPIHFIKYLKHQEETSTRKLVGNENRQNRDVSHLPKDQKKFSNNFKKIKLQQSIVLKSALPEEKQEFDTKVEEEKSRKYKINGDNEKENLLRGSQQHAREHSISGKYQNIWIALLIFTGLLIVGLELIK